MAKPPPPLLLIVAGPVRNRPPVADLLDAAGFATATAGTPHDVVPVIAATRAPDLVILDGVTSPGDAYAVQTALRDAAPTRLIPVLALVPVDGHSSGEAALDGVVDDVLPQPVEREQFHLRVRSLLRTKERCNQLSEDIQRLTDIGISLSAEHNLDRLLELILDEARAINCADAGTLYTVDWDAGVLRFQITQNDTLDIRMGGTSGKPIQLPPVPLDRAYVSSYVALTGETLNITDVYESEGFDFSGTRKYDAMTGYRCRSMLVVPMKNHDDEVVAVLQLFNAQKPGTRRVVPFMDPNVERTRALASQAGIAINNARLIHDLQEFLEGLIRVMAVAIDEKSPYTSGHIQRVTRLAVHLAEAVNEAPEETYSGRRFTVRELDELRIAGLLHDIGKIVIPEYVVDKATKLHTLYDRIEAVRTRFSVIRRGIENAALRRKLQLVESGAGTAALAEVDERLRGEVDRLEADLAFIQAVNQGGEFLQPEKIQRIEEIGQRTYLDDAGQPQPFLTENEIRNLSIPKGTLLPEELEVIRSHAEVSIRLLEGIPFAHRLRNVPVYAGDHHEALNGTGYPRGKTAEQLPLQSRILAIADIYDALTAADRPYKKQFSVETAYRILREEAERGKLDARLVETFIGADCPGRAKGSPGEILQVPEVSAPPLPGRVMPARTGSEERAPASAGV